MHIRDIIIHATDVRTEVFQNDGLTSEQQRRAKACALPTSADMCTSTNKQMTVTFTQHSSQMQKKKKNNFPLGVNLKTGTRMMINVVDLEIKKKKSLIIIPVINVSEAKASNNHTSQVLKTEVIMLTQNLKPEARL